MPLTMPTIVSRAVDHIRRQCLSTGRLRRTLLVVGIVIAPPLHAQRVGIDSVAINDSTVVHAIYLADGARLVGRIMLVTADSVRVVSASATTMIARSAIREVRQYPTAEMRGGALWPENPHASRLIFAPTAIPLRPGEAYFSDFWVFLVSAGVGVTDRVTIGAGMSLVPGVSLDKNLLFLLPKVAVINQPKLKVAVGGLLARVGGFESGSQSLGILYGVATTGSRESNLTIGAGWGYVGGTLSNKPVLTLGGQHRVARRLSLISENWFFPFDNSSSGIISYGVRILGEKIAVDLAFAIPIDNGDAWLPGIPLLGFAVKF